MLFFWLTAPPLKLSPAAEASGEGLGGTRKAKNVGITEVTARLFNAVRRNSEELATISAAKKSKSKFIISVLEDYIKETPLAVE